MEILKTLNSIAWSQITTVFIVFKLCSMLNVGKVKSMLQILKLFISGVKMETPEKPKNKDTAMVNTVLYCTG